MKDSLLIKDSIHGLVELEALREDLVKTPEFQRLNWVSQNGLAKLVYPSVNTTRFEHCIGVSHVASKAAEHLSLPLSERDILVAAGLLHDVGHGPFSHALEHIIEKSHEQVGVDLILGREAIGEGRQPQIPIVLERHGLKPKEVVGLISGERAKKPYLHDLVSGDVDCDRLDYLARDAHSSGVAFLDFERIVKTMALRGKMLCFLEKGAGALEGFLVSRNLMYNTLYLHHATVIAEAMLRKAVLAHRQDLEDFHLWTDYELLYSLKSAGGLGSEVVDRVVTRQLYKRAFELKSAQATLEDLQKLKKAVVSEEEFEKVIAEKARVPLKDVIVSFPHEKASKTLSLGKEVNVPLLRKDGSVVELRDYSSIIAAMAKRLDSPHLLGVYTPEKHRGKVGKAVQGLLS